MFIGKRVLSNFFSERRLKKELGFKDLVLIGLGATIEASIFVLIAPGAEIVGKYLPISFILGGALALGVALVYSEIATNLPEEGADLRFIFKSFSSDIWAFITSWLVILGDLSYLALNLLGLTVYLKTFLPINQLAFSIIILLAITVLNLRGIKRTSLVENSITMVLLFFLAVIVGWAFFNWVGENQIVNNISSSDSFILLPIIVGTALIYSSFIGYEDITSVAGEVKDPHKNIPKAMIITVIITTSLYVVLSFLSVQTIPLAQLKESETPLLLLAITNNIPSFIVTAAAILAIVSTLVITLLVASRKVFALAQEDYFKNWLGNTNSSGVPTQAVLFCTFITLILTIIGSVKFVAYLGNSVYLIGVIATTVALLIMHRKNPNFGRWFRVPFSPYLPLLIIFVSGTVLIFVETRALFYVFVWGLIGAFIYHLNKR